MTLWQPRGLIQPNRDWRRPQTTGSGSTVLFDAKSTAVSSSGGLATSMNDDLMTVGASLTNSALTYILICGDGTTISNPSVNWDSLGTPLAMTLLGSATNSSQQLFLFGLRNPTAGNKRASSSWTGSAQVRGYAASFQNVDQTSDAIAFPGFNSATNAAPISVNISSATGDKAIGSYLSLANFTSASGTTLLIDNTFTVWAWAASYDDGASTVSLSGSPGSAVTALAVGVNIKAA